MLLSPRIARLDEADDALGELQLGPVLDRRFEQLVPAAGGGISSLSSSSISADGRWLTFASRANDGVFGMGPGVSALHGNGFHLVG